MNCSTPSSGFYSEVGGLLQTNNHEHNTTTCNADGNSTVVQGTTTTFDQQMKVNQLLGEAENPGKSSSSKMMMYDQLYQSAEQVRSNKNYQVILLIHLIVD